MSRDINCDPDDWEDDWEEVYICPVCNTNLDDDGGCPTCGWDDRTEKWSTFPKRWKVRE